MEFSRCKSDKHTPLLTPNDKKTLVSNFHFNRVLKWTYLEAGACSPLSHGDRVHRGRPFLPRARQPCASETPGLRDIGEGLQRGGQRGVDAAGISVWSAAGLGGRLWRSGPLVFLG